MTGIVDFRAELVDPNNAPITPENPLPVSSPSLEALRRIASLLKPLGVVTGGGSNRLSVDVNNVVGGNLAGVTTVGAVTNVNGFVGVSAFDTAKAISRQAYNSGIRTRL